MRSAVPCNDVRVCAAMHTVPTSGVSDGKVFERICASIVSQSSLSIVSV